MPPPEEAALSSISAPLRNARASAGSTGADATHAGAKGRLARGVGRVCGRIADASAPRDALPRLRHRPDLQGLRGIAVVLVVLSHAGVPWLAGGYIGVDVFLVLSGYLITSLLLHEATATGSVSLVTFYARRARRILPAATLVLVTTALVATLTLPYSRADQVLRDVLWAAFFAANVHVAAVGTDYFTADLPPSPVQHFWSLAVEEQFYVVWPVVVALVLAVGLRRHRAGAVGARRRVLLLAVLVACLCVASFAWATTSSATDPTGAYFSTPARVWELGVGALLALTGRLPSRLPFAVRVLLSWGGLAAVLAPAVTFDATTAVPGPSALLPVLGTVALLAAGAAGPGAGAGRLLSGRRLGRLGDLSYGFYLWHWPFLVLPALHVGSELRLLDKVGLVLLALAASALSYRLLEDPVRRVRSLGHRPHLALSLWPLAVTAVLGTALWCGGRIAVAAAAGSGAPVVVRAGSGTSQSTATDTEPIAAAVEQAVDQARADAPLPAVAQDLRTLAEDKWDRVESCVADQGDTSADLCPVGDVGADRTIVVLGDSHAGQWLPPVARLGQEQGWRVVPLVKYGCPAIDWPAWRSLEERPSTECSRFHDWALDQVAALRPEVVVVGSRATLELADERATAPLTSGAAALDAWQTGMGRLVERLSESAGAVRLVLDTPSLDEEPADCLSAPEATMGTCTADLPVLVSDVNARTRAAAASEGAQVVDMTRYVCAEHTCPMVVSGIAVYADDNHLSATYVDHIATAFIDSLDLPAD